MVATWLVLLLTSSVAAGVWPALRSAGAQPAAHPEAAGAAHAEKPAAAAPEKPATATPEKSAAAPSGKPAAEDHAAPAAKTGGGAAPHECHPRDGTRLLLDFFALPTAADEPQGVDKALAAQLARGDLRLQFLLATAPEPRLGFDGAVEAMSRAIEAAGYTLDRYDLPWEPGGPPKGSPPCYEQHPGAALFLHLPDPKIPGDPRRLLLLYVIGETPISGIHKPAFLRAIKEMQHLRTLVPSTSCPSCETVRLVGPAFSGSVTSLEVLLDALPELSFNILSGRATNGQIRPRLLAHSNSRRTVRFQATVIPDDVLQAEFFRYLRDTLGVDEHDVALVTESSTVYGQGVIAQNTPFRSHGPRMTLPVPLHISRLHSALAKRTPTAKRDNSDSLLTNLTATPPQLLDDTQRTDVFPALSERTLAAEDRALAHILSTISAEKIHYVGILATDVQDKLFLAYQIRTYSPDVVLFTFEGDILYTHPDARAYLKGMMVVSPYPLFTRNQQWTYPFRGWQQRLQFSSDTDQGVYNATVALLGRSDQLIEYSQPSFGVKQPQNRPPIWISVIGNETFSPLAVITHSYDDYGYVYQYPAVAHNEYLYAPYQQGTLSALLLILGLVGVLLCTAYFRCYYAGPGELPLPWSFFKVLRPGGAGKWQPNGTPMFGDREVRRQPLFLLFVFGPMWVIYLLIGTMHFMQLRDGNHDSSLSASELPWELRIWHHFRHLGVYENLSWNVLGIALLTALCQLAFTVTSLDILASMLLPGPRARFQELLRRRFAALRSWQRSLLYAVLGAALLAGISLWFSLFVSAVNHLQHDFNTLLVLGRSAHPAVGLSPAMPMWLLCASVQLWGYCNLHRIYLIDKLASIYIDLIAELAEDSELRSEVTRLAKQLESPGRLGVMSAIAFSLFLAVTVLTDLMSLEHRYLNFVFRFLFALVLSNTGYAFYRFLRLWYGVRVFLQHLAHHPIAAALERLPPQLSRSLSALLLSDVPDQTRRDAERRHFHLLMNHLAQLHDRELAALSDSNPEAVALRAMLVELRDQRADPSCPPDSSGELGTAPVTASGAKPAASCASDNAEDRRMVRAARQVVQILKHFWAARPLLGTVVGRGDEKPSVAPQTLPPTHNTAESYLQVMPDTLHLWLRLAEDFISIQVASYVTRLFPHLRNTMLFVTVSLLLVLGAIFTYPFQPQRFLLILVWVVILVTGPLTVLTLLQMNRDEVLSRIAKSEPGKVTWDRHFISQIVIYGVLPLFSLIASQFPEVRGAAFSWLESLLKTLK